MNEETLEEAAKKYDIKSTRWGAKDIFIDGAKWQAERMYSKEEVKHLIHLACHHSGVSVFKRFGQWFEKYSSVKNTK